jgi:hypothetical protein
LLSVPAGSFHCLLSVPAGSFHCLLSVPAGSFHCCCLCQQAVSIACCLCQQAVSIACCLCQQAVSIVAVCASRQFPLLISTAVHYFRLLTLSEVNDKDPMGRQQLFLPSVSHCAHLHSTAYCNVVLWTFHAVFCCVSTLSDGLCCSLYHTQCSSCLLTAEPCLYLTI